MIYAPPPPMLPKLAAIAALVEDSTQIEQDFRLQPKYLATLPGGELYMDGELQLDTDGWHPPPNIVLDDDHDDETSLRYRDDGSIDANAVPYIVLPLPQSWAADRGVALGDYAAVLYGSRLAFAVFADEGPPDEIGEGSLELFRRLGQERVRELDVWNTGMEPPVVMIVFPGSGRGQRHFPDQAALLADMDSVARERFIALGGEPDA
ncbi:MAG: hypothetical protein QOG72_3212 [Sphingomonadales bacterium]|jgi:hypothetical protein|nr:hypothetical protein [Sphingomonadales bacterium]